VRAASSRSSRSAVSRGSWLIDTTTVLVTRMLGWDLDSYEAWVAATLTRLLTGPGVTGSRTGR
jgi:hypothetical protein